MVEIDPVNWTDPVKLPPVAVGGLWLGTAIFLQDPKGAPACEKNTCKQPNFNAEWCIACKRSRLLTKGLVESSLAQTCELIQEVKKGANGWHNI